MTPDNKSAAPGLDEPSDDFDKLSADLTRAKNLLVRLWDKHPAARSQIEACTGTWFAWGTDRDAALSQPVPSAPEPSDAQLNYAPLYDFATKHGIPYNALCAVVRESAAHQSGLDSAAAPPVPAAAPAVEPTVEGDACEVLRKLASYLGAGGYNAPAVDPQAFYDKIMWGIGELEKRAALPASPEPATQGAAKPVHTNHPFQHWDRTCPACVLEASPPAPEPLTPAAGEPDERVLNLLARIHRDGGHYVAEHGLHKALQDAEGIVIEQIAALDEIAELTTATPGLSDADSAKEASDEWFHEDSLELVGWKYHGKGDGEGTFRLITPNDTYNPDQVTPGSMVPVYARLSGSPVQPAVRGDAEALRDAHLYGFVCVPDPSVPHDQAVFKLNGREIGRVANIGAALAQTPEGKDEP